jgi:hypothetical protein
MRWFAFSLMLVCGAMIGCEQPTEKIEKSDVKIPSPTVESGSSAVTDEPEAPAAVETSAPPVDPASAPADAEPKPDSASAKSADAVRFVATQSVKVPTMMCPYSCWPKVKEALAAQPGVEGVQLAAQVKETEIDNPVVELKTTGDFNVEAAIAALEKINFANAVAVK